MFSLFQDVGEWRNRAPPKMPADAVDQLSDEEGTAAMPIKIGEPTAKPKAKVRPKANPKTLSKNKKPAASKAKAKAVKASESEVAPKIKPGAKKAAKKEEEEEPEESEPSKPAAKKAAKKATKKEKEATNEPEPKDGDGTPPGGPKKRPAACNPPEIRAYKYKYHQRNMFGIKVNKSEVCVVRFSGTNRCFKAV